MVHNEIYNGIFMDQWSILWQFKRGWLGNAPTQWENMGKSKENMRNPQTSHGGLELGK
jgi:hypothetical protein